MHYLLPVSLDSVDVGVLQGPVRGRPGVTGAGSRAQCQGRGRSHTTINISNNVKAEVGHTQPLTFPTMSRPR